MITIALGLPHTPWIPERVKSFQRLRDQLSVALRTADLTRVFDEKESNRVWPGKLWRWGVATGASHTLQLQDDVIVAPNFWKILRAMLEAVPDKIIGLESNHPLGPEMHRTGRRWYRTRAWLVGVGYVFPNDPTIPCSLPNFIAWCDTNPGLVEQANEDALISHWVATLGYDIFHPIPTIIDHDISIPSTYGNDAHHEWSMYRRPTVTWRDALHALESMTSPDHWRTSVASAPLLPSPGTQRCWFCGVRAGIMTSTPTGCRLCPQCCIDALQGLFARAFPGVTPAP